MKYSDTATYWLKSENCKCFLPHSHLVLPVRNFGCSLWKFAVKLTIKETTVMGLSSSEDRIVVA